MDLPFEGVAGFFQWLTSPAGGAFIIVAWFVSWAFEKYEAWHNLPSRARSVIMVGAALVIAVSAQYMQGNQAFLDAISPYFGPVLGVIVAWLATQSAHALNPFKSKG